MAKTLALARKLGLVEERYFNVSREKSGILVQGKESQTFSYVIVIDFESTCWDRDEKSHPNEIIEFPALLVDLSDGRTVAQFHHYVQPMEQPTLSKFCTNLTGISQTQVDDSAPIDIVMSKFKRWMSTVSNEYNFGYNSGAGKLCTFVTWTNWDLGVCLLAESRRKNMLFPEQLSSWIDLKATYKRFYARPPKRLRESMNEVGLQFEGREHSGIIDSKNTVRLLLKLVADGCVLQLTNTKK